MSALANRPSSKSIKSVRIGSCVEIPERNVPNPSQALVERTRELVITEKHLQLYKTAFLNYIQNGLRKGPNSEKCCPTYVQDLPNGRERGKFLALEFGAGKIQIMMIILAAKILQGSKVFSLPQELGNGTVEQLFDFLAQCLSDFVAESGIVGQPLPLSFSFDFPFTQKGLNVGILRRWTKDINCKGAVGNDVGLLLKEAIAKKGLRLRLVAVTNKAVGAMMACTYKEKKAHIGMILGTESSACYIESQANVEHFDAPDRGTGKVIVTCDTGSFGDDGVLQFCRTEYDAIVDQRSPNPGQQIKDKLVSAMYLGELVRLAAEKFTREGLIFEGKGSGLLFASGKFETGYVCEIENEEPGVFLRVKEICDELGLNRATYLDYTNLRYLCQCFSRRSAYFISAELSALIEKVGENECVVALDGNMFREHQRYHARLTAKIRELINPNQNFEIRLVDADDNGVGAALVAAVIERLAKKKVVVKKKVPVK